MDSNRLKCTYETVKEIVQKAKFDSLYSEKVIQDVLLIVNHNKKYPHRGGTEEYRIPEDVSTYIALDFFQVDAYSG